MSHPVRTLLPRSGLLLALALAACGPTAPDEPPVSAAEAASVCAGVSCTAGRCASDHSGTPVCVCGSEDAAAGRTCAVDEVGDLDDQVPSRARMLVPDAPALQARLHRFDVDWYVFDAEPGVRFRVECTPQGFPTCEPGLMTVAGPGGQATRVVRGGATLVDVRAESPSRFAVAVSAWPAGAADVRGTYTLRLVRVHDDTGDAASGARAVAVGGAPIDGRLDYPGDVDAFSFPALRGHLYAARCTGDRLQVDVMGARTDLSVGATFRDPVPGGTELLFEPPVDVPALLVVRGPDDGLPAYTCTLTDRGVDDHGDLAAQATALQGASLELVGALELPNDADYFTFQARAGHAYALDCADAFPDACSSSYLEVPSRTIPPRPITVAADGPVAVRVASTSGGSTTWRGWTGAYRMVVRDLGPDQGSGPGDAVPLTVGTPVDGLLSPAFEVDAFTFRGEPGRVYGVSVSNPARVAVYRASEPTHNLLPYLYAERGVFVTPADEALTVTVTGHEGPYVLRVEALGWDDHADTAALATPLALPVPRAEGVADGADDVDWFAVDLAVRTYRAAFVAPSAAGLRFQLLEADGVTAVPSDWWTGAFTPRAPGRHLLRITAESTYFDARAPYRLDLAPQ